jgi:hypothetical protein
MLADSGVLALILNSNQPLGRHLQYHRGSRGGDNADQAQALPRFAYHQNNPPTQQTAPRWRPLCPVCHFMTQCAIGMDIERLSN